MKEAISSTCAAIVREISRTAKRRENVGTGSTNSLKYLMENVSQHMPQHKSSRVICQILENILSEGSEPSLKSQSNIDSFSMPFIDGGSLALLTTL